MNLKDYLSEEKITVTAFAKKLMIHRTYLSEILTGKYTPSKRLARDIEKATKGKVKAVDLLKDKDNKNLL